MDTEQFYALPMNEKAVMVAKDVIAQIVKRRYIPMTGNYIKFVNYYDYNFDGQIKDKFDEIDKCKVCALGATLMSCTHLGNRLTFEEIGFDIMVSHVEIPGVSELLKKVFTPHTLLLIEMAFEGYNGNTDKEEFHYAHNVCSLFWRKFIS